LEKRREKPYTLYTAILYLKSHFGRENFSDANIIGGLEVDFTPEYDPSYSAFNQT
jgi:hypothetical protein